MEGDICPLSVDNGAAPAIQFCASCFAGADWRGSMSGFSPDWLGSSGRGLHQSLLTAKNTSLNPEKTHCYLVMLLTPAWHPPDGGSLLVLPIPSVPLTCQPIGLGPRLDHFVK